MDYTQTLFSTGAEAEEHFRSNFSKLLGEEMVEKLIEKGFLKAPASTRYHGNYGGGLYEHSVNVVNALLELTQSLGLKWERPESPVIIGLLHDLCKIDQYKMLGEEGEGLPVWTYDNSSLVKGHGIKSVIYCQQMGISLTEEEMACIIYHMGAFTDKEEWNDYTQAIHTYPNVLWTHTADMVAAHVMEV